MNNPSDPSQRSRQLLAAHMEKARIVFSDFLDTHGASLAVLGKAMEEFTLSVFDLPEEAACTPGCAWCCHLRVGVSIPELLVIFEELTAQVTPQGLTLFKARIDKILASGNTLDEAFWHKSQTSCPFLDEKNGCLIYPIRPFSCRAHHSIDAAVCQKGYDEKTKVMIPCFPLYRATTDMYSSIFIKVMADRGFDSYQVGFVKGLGLLFENPQIGRDWLEKKDSFAPVKLLT